MKRGQKKKIRSKRVLKAKHTKKPEKKIVSQKIPSTKGLPWNIRIRYHFFGVIRKIKRAGCFIGLHDWKVCSGREGDSMYTCLKCWKGSAKKWGKGGSKDYYDKKYEDKLGINDSKNWEKKGNKWYFKGEYIELGKEQRRRLKVILGRNKEVKK